MTLIEAALVLVLVAVAIILLGGIYVDQQDFSADDSMLDSTRPPLDSPPDQHPTTRTLRREGIALSSLAHPALDVKATYHIPLPHNTVLVKRTGHMY